MTPRVRFHRTTGVLLVISAAVALTGCGRSGDDKKDDKAAAPPSAKEVAGGQATGEINIWAMGDEATNFKKLTAGFEKENPGIKINVTAVPWGGAHDKLTGAIAAKKTPDMSVIGTTWMGEFAKSGALEATPASFDKSKFYDGSWSSTVVDGQSYSVPWYADTRVLFYRKDLAAKAGINEAPKTWDELKTLATALKEKGGAKYGIYLNNKEGSFQETSSFAWSAGGDIVDPAGKFTLDTPAWSTALDYSKSFFDAGLAPKALQAGEADQMFVSGQLGAYINGAYNMQALKKAAGPEFAEKYAVAPMPKGSASGTSFSGGGDLAVFKGAKNRDGAWKLVEYLTRADVQAEWWNIQHDLPAVKEAWTKGELASDPKIKVFGTQLNDAKAPPAYPTWEQIGKVIDRSTEQVTIGGKPSAEVVKDMQAQAARIGAGN